VKNINIGCALIMHNGALSLKNKFDISIYEFF